MGPFILVFMSVVSAFLLALFGLAALARILAARTTSLDVPSSLYATAVLREIRSDSHRILNNDPEYRRRLFQRYAPLLRRDMVALLRRGVSLSAVFWYLCFEVYYRVLSFGKAASLLGIEQDGLDILLSATQRGWRTAR